MQNSSIGAKVKQVPVTLITMHFAVTVLVVASIVAALQTIGGVVHTIEHVHTSLLAAALVAALGPAVAVIFWSAKVFIVQLATSFQWVSKHFERFRDQRADGRFGD